MSKYSSSSKPCKYDNNSPFSRILQSSMCASNNGAYNSNENEKIRIMKVDSMPCQQLKRRRSRSHNLTEYSNGYLYHGDQNNAPYSELSTDNSQFSQNSTSISNNHWIKEKHKKETHNRVERKRRDFINGQIQRLSDLLPSESFFNYDLKMNKGVILKNSVEYISSMKTIEEINRQLILENEIASRLIRILISFNDINCSELSLNGDVYEELGKEEMDINTMIKEWDSIHQENKELLLKNTKKQSNVSSENKNDFIYEKFSTVDAKNNNPILITTSRKRYSSVPTSISNDYYVSKSIPTHNIVDKTSTILNSLLKKTDTYKHLKESIPQTFSLNDNANIYLQCTSIPPLTDDMATNDITILEPQLYEPSTNDNNFQIKNKVYYILPKSAKILLPDQNPDPMLLSDNVTFVD